MKLVNPILLVRSYRAYSSQKKATDAKNDEKIKINNYPPVYENDEQMRLNIALAIAGTGIGLITVAANDFLKNYIYNAGAYVFGGIILLYALFYILSTATRLRYQNPGEANSWYISESGRRNIYDEMVQMFWLGVFLIVEIAIPVGIGILQNPWINGILVGSGVFIALNFIIWLNVSSGIDNDRLTGNLLYNHAKKLKTAKQFREPFDAPPVKRK